MDVAAAAAQAAAATLPAAAGTARHGMARYHELQEIARGTYGRVSMAQDLATGERVALKYIEAGQFGSLSKCVPARARHCKAAAAADPPPAGCSCTDTWSAR